MVSEIWDGREEVAAGGSTIVWELDFFMKLIDIQDMYYDSQKKI